MDNQFMQEAINEARLAQKSGEVPVGAVLTYKGNIIARAHNRTMESSHMLSHAEMLVLDSAVKQLGTRRLSGCSLYVTLEPCPMCAGAILLLKPDKVYFGAYDLEKGACGGKFDLFREEKTEIYGGIMERECADILKDFFASLR